MPSSYWLHVPSFLSTYVMYNSVHLSVYENLHVQLAIRSVQFLEIIIKLRQLFLKGWWRDVRISLAHLFFHFFFFLFLRNY